MAGGMAEEGRSIMQAPESITKLLTNMDPLLSVRWGPYAGKWVIERTAVTPITELRWLERRRERRAAWIRAGRATDSDRSDLQSLSEEIESLKRGKRVILIVERVDMEVYNALCMGDIKRYGGYSRYAEQVETAQFEREQRGDAAFSHWVEDAGREAFGYGNGGLSPYDFMMSKKRKGALLELQRGTKTLKECLGLRPEQSILGSESYVAPSTRTRVLVDSSGRPLTPAV